MDSNLTLALVGVVSALLGVIISGFFNLRITKLTKESEERKHHKQIVVNAAVENWKQSLELLKASGRGGIFPLESFMVAAAAAANVIFDPTTNADNLEGRLKAADRLVQIAERCARERDIQPRE